MDKVSFAVLHSGIFIKGYGNLDKTLDPNNATLFSKEQNLTLSTSTDKKFLHVSIRGRGVDSKVTYSINVPMSNVSHYIDETNSK